MSQKVSLVISNVLHVRSSLWVQGQLFLNPTLDQKNPTVSRQPR